MNLYSLAPVCVFALLTGCLSRKYNDAEFKAQPANTDVNVDCNLENDPLGKADSELKFRGKTAEYFDSSQIPYQNDQWLSRTSPWISFAGLDSSILGFPGFDGTSAGRAFSPTAAINARVVAIDIRKIGGKLKYHYFSNETLDSPMENWSSTKALAMFMAAQVIRKESAWTHGMGSSIVDGKGANGATLASAVTDVADTSNNFTAVWFKSFAGAAGANNFAKNWLGGGSRTEFGGGHGEPPQPWGNRLLSQSVTKTFPGVGNFVGVTNNTVMPVIMAEFWKRIGVNHSDARTFVKKDTNYTSKEMTAAEREASFDSTAEPGITKQDLGVLLYGAATGSKFGGLLLGGSDSDRFVNSLGGKTNLDSKFGGNWRFYGKTGTGQSNRSGRTRNEQIIGGFVCLPASPKNVVLKHGRAFAFFINIQAAGDTQGPRAATLAALIPITFSS